MTTRLLWQILLAQSSRTREQVQAVRERLLRATQPFPRYKTVVQLSGNGGLMSFTCRVPLAVGDMVSADIRGELAPMGVNSMVLGVVVSQEVQL